MPGTRTGGLKIKETMIAKLGGLEAYNKWVRERGSKGGKKSSNSEWANSPEGHAHLVAAGQKAWRSPLHVTKAHARRHGEETL